MTENVNCDFENIGDDGRQITYRCEVCKQIVKVYGDVAPPNKVCSVATLQKRKQEREAAKALKAAKKK